MALSPSQDRFNQQLRLRSRDQDSRRDLQVEAEKFLMPGEVLQGFEMHAALYKECEAAGLLRRERRFGMCEQPWPGTTENVQ